MGAGSSIENFGRPYFSYYQLQYLLAHVDVGTDLKKNFFLIVSVWLTTYNKYF